MFEDQRGDIHEDYWRLKIRVYPWKWMFGIQSFPFGARPIFRGKLAVSFREGKTLNFFYQATPSNFTMRRNLRSKTIHKRAVKNPFISIALYTSMFFLGGKHMNTWHACCCSYQFISFYQRNIIFTKRKCPFLVTLQRNPRHPITLWKDDWGV